MVKKLDYSDKIIEPFAITTIANSYDAVYNSFFWNKKKDDFDFINNALGVGLEVSVVITKNTQTVVSYQNSLRKDITTIKLAMFDENSELRAWYGGSGGELRNLIVERILLKNTKAKKHIRPEIKECQLCLCVDDGGWFEKESEFDFLKSMKLNEDVIFHKIFIITSSLFLVYEGDKITRYPRKVCGTGSI